MLPSARQTLRDLTTRKLGIRLKELGCKNQQLSSYGRPRAWIFPELGRFRTNIETLMQISPDWPEQADWSEPRAQEEHKDVPY